MSTECNATNLPIKDLFDAKNKTDIFLNISDSDKEKLIKFNSWAIKGLEYSILERLNKKNIRVNQGDIWSVDLGENVGAEMNETRPCIAISCNEFDSSSLVTVIPITNNNSNFPTNVSIKDLGMDNILSGTAKAEQVKTISKARLGKKISSLDKDGVLLIQEALMKHLGFSNEMTSIFKMLSNNPELQSKVLDLLK